MLNVKLQANLFSIKKKKSVFKSRNTMQVFLFLIYISIVKILKITANSVCPINQYYPIIRKQYSSLLIYCADRRWSGQGKRLLNLRSQVRIPVKAQMSSCPLLAPLVAALKNWQMGGARFTPRSRLSTQPFEVFRNFLRISRKYGLGSLRKTSTKGTPPIELGP